MSVVVNKEHMDQIKEDIDYLMAEYDGCPTHMLIQAVLDLLDTAQSVDKRLNGQERMKALDYITEEYGYDF